MRFKLNPAPLGWGIKSHWKGLFKYSHISAAEPRDILKRCGIKSQKKILMAGIFMTFLLAFFVFAGEGLADYKSDEYGLKTTVEGSELKNTFKTTDLSTQIGIIVGAVLAFVGVIFLILMIYGGFLWMTASGNEQQVDKAKNLITAAIIGLIIVFAAYAITAYIGGKLGQTPTETPPS